MTCLGGLHAVQSSCAVVIEISALGSPRTSHLLVTHKRNLGSLLLKLGNTRFRKVASQPTQCWVQPDHFDYHFLCYWKGTSTLSFAEPPFTKSDILDTQRHNISESSEHAPTSI
mmetsp:Transcript_1107/g.2072  ORF Transcript_1107/g.2072 Transcript_1107/m.2072 type:complete len:114 (-) Transcript_1107:964-1305(-)